MRQSSCSFIPTNFPSTYFTSSGTSVSSGLSKLIVEGISGLFLFLDFAPFCLFPLPTPYSLSLSTKNELDGELSNSLRNPFVLLYFVLSKRFPFYFTTELDLLIIIQWWYINNTHMSWSIVPYIFLLDQHVFMINILAWYHKYIIQYYIVYVHLFFYVFNLYRASLYLQCMINTNWRINTNWQINTKCDSDIWFATYGTEYNFFSQKSHIHDNQFNRNIFIVDTHVCYQNQHLSVGYWI